MTPKMKFALLITLLGTVFFKQAIANESDANLLDWNRLIPADLEVPFRTDCMVYRPNWAGNHFCVRSVSNASERPEYMILMWSAEPKERCAQMQPKLISAAKYFIAKQHPGVREITYTKEAGALYGCIEAKYFIRHRDRTVKVVKALGDLLKADEADPETIDRIVNYIRRAMSESGMRQFNWSYRLFKPSS